MRHVGEIFRILLKGLSGGQARHFKKEVKILEHATDLAAAYIPERHARIEAVQIGQLIGVSAHVIERTANDRLAFAEFELRPTGVVERMARSANRRIDLFGSVFPQRRDPLFVGGVDHRYFESAGEPSPARASNAGNSLWRARIGREAWRRVGQDHSFTCGGYYVVILTCHFVRAKSGQYQRHAW